MRITHSLAILAMGVTALLLGLGAASTGGAARAWLLFVAFLAALSLPAIVAHAAQGHPSDRTVGGSGYRPPEDRRIRVLHLMLTTLYNLGVATVVFAALVRSRLVDLQIPEPLVQLFPALIGAYTLLLALASVWRLDEGGAVNDWYTRTHGMALGAVGAVVGAVAVFLAVAGHFDVGSLRIAQRDLLVFILVGTLGIGTQMFLSVRLPTLVELITAYVRMWVPDKDDRGDTPPIVYVGLLAIVATAIIAFVLVQFNIASVLENRFADARITFLVLLLPIGVAVFFVSSAIVMYRESKRGFFKRKMTRRLRNDIIVYTTSTALGLAFATALWLGLSGRPTVLGIPVTVDLIKDLTMLSIVSTTGPIGFYIHREYRRINDIEARLSDFLNDLSDARRAGMPLATALQNTAGSDYGAFTPEVAKMAKQVAWGVSFNEALQRMGDRVPSALVKRAVTLVIEASHTGGSVSDILKAAGRDAYEIKSLERDRKVTMTTYLIVIYVVFFVFMVVIAILDIRFIPQIASAAQSIEDAGLSGGALKVDSVDPESMRFIYFNATMVQAIGNGIVGGVLAEGRVMSGFRHAAVLALIGWFTFRFVLPAL